MAIVTILVLAVAIGLGMLANSRVRPFAKVEVQGVKLELLVSPLLTLTTLLLAFVLVQVFSSYNRAKMSAGDEAGQVIAEYRLFSYLNDETGENAQKALLCYARSVAHLEWPVMRDPFQTAPEVFHWGVELGDILTVMAAERPGQPFGALITTDKQRAEARRRRIQETRPAVPKPVSWLMLAVSGLAVLSIATFTLPYVARRVQAGALIMLSLVFAGVQIAILEIDSKYDGWIRVGPEEMQFVAEIMDRFMALPNGELELPCDAEGRPLL